tara:strand:+ start:124 stop:522 length:399 start_codon:yes stop_codon:yes gene_type:complete
MLGEFQKNVIYIATTILVILLVIITILIYKSLQNANFPAISNVCPDYWDLSGDICIPNIYQNVSNSGNCGWNDCSNIDISVFNQLDENSALCAKKHITQVCNLSWDGVSNSNIDCKLYNYNDNICPNNSNFP